VNSNGLEGITQFFGKSAINACDAIGLHLKQMTHFLRILRVTDRIASGQTR